MIHLHATKKLFAKLPVDDEGLLPASANDHALANNAQLTTNPLSGWHANLLTIQRRNCVLLIHDATRFPLFIPGLTKPDFAALNHRFADSLMNTLLACEATAQQLDAAAQLLAPLHIDTNCNRSVQGTMNQMKGDVEYLIHYDAVDITTITGYRAGAWLAQRPCTVKGQKDCLWPTRTMLTLLDKLGST